MNTETNPKIHPEFSKLIPAMTEEEFSLLEKSCIHEGIRDKLVVWNGFLIDGHNRLEIAEKHGLEFKVSGKYFNNEDEVIDWIITNQLGKRNLTAEQKSYLRGRRYEQEKLKQGRPDKSYQNDNLKTHEKLAEEYNVGPATITRDAEYSKAIDKIGSLAGHEAKNKILNGEIKATKKDILALADKDAEEIKGVIDNVKSGQSQSVAEGKMLFHVEKHFKAKQNLNPLAEKSAQDQIFFGYVAACLKHTVMTKAEIFEDFREYAGYTIDEFSDGTANQCYNRFIQLVKQGYLKGLARSLNG